MDPNLLKLIDVQTFGSYVLRGTAFDPHFYVTSKETSEDPAFDRITRALHRGPDAADHEATDKGSLTEFHELNVLFVAEACRANELLGQLSRELAPNDPSVDELRARFDAHCEAAGFYLDDALEAATCVHDRMVVIENRASLALLRGDAKKAATQYLAALSVRPTETLWANLLIALDQLGADEVIDHILVEVGRTGTPRMIAMIDADRDLANVRKRSAYHRHVAHRA